MAVVKVEFIPKSNPVFTVDVATGAAAAAETEVAPLLPIFGQAEVLLFCTGLVPVVGHGLVLSWVKLEAPVNGLIGALLALFEADDDPVVVVAAVDVPQFGTQLGEKPRFSLAAAGGS